MSAKSKPDKSFVKAYSMDDTFAVVAWLERRTAEIQKTLKGKVLEKAILEAEQRINDLMAGKGLSGDDTERMQWCWASAELCALTAAARKPAVKAADRA